MNLGTKFHQVQQKFSGETSYSPDIDKDLDNIYKSTVQSGSNSVKTLTSKFDYRDNKEVEETEADLKSVVKEQKKLICNLKDQVEVKDRRIKELEVKVKLLLTNNPAASFDISTKQLNEHSLA